MSIEIDSPSLLYSGSDNMVFCVGAIGISGGIYLIDAITGEYEEIPLQCPSDEIFDFVYDGNQILYVCYNEEGYIKAINTNTLEISDPIDVHQNPTDLEYDPGNNLLFCADDYGINIISINGWNEYNVMEIFTGDYTKRMVFRPQNQDRKLYLIGLSHLSIYNLDKSVLLQQQVDAQGILYNPFNDRVYLNYDYLPNNNYHGLLVAYDCNTDQVCSEILLSQKNLMMGIFLTNPLEPYQMVLNSTSNQLYCGNGAFSNISVIDCKNETRSLRPGWTWLSFPRLDREGNDPVQAVDLLTGHILPENFISGQMRNLPSQSLIENYIDYLIDPFPHWTPEYGLLDEVISTCGYKLYTSPEEERRMDVAGTIVDRQTSISIYSGYENWVGYFHEMPQDVFDALATEVLEELTLIKTQDWACAKYYMPPIQQGDPPVPVWICSTKNPLRYGDMVILKTSSDLTFQWNPPEARPEHKALKNTEHYVFEEKSDYVPIYIQLDSTDNPDEIGAFINDSCMGACGVEWGDTLVMIRGYFGENQGEEVTFEEYYDSLKAAPVRKNEYYVYDPQSFLYKKRMIKTNDKNDWYLISFSPKKNTPATPLKNRIHFFPNPCMNNCLIEFQVPVESDISIDLYDIYGRLIKTMVYGHYLPGTYSVLWNNSLHSGRLIPEGVYLLMMTAGSHRDAEKVIITM
jgi:hypothetical protein